MISFLLVTRFDLSVLPDIFGQTADKGFLFVPP